MSDTSTPPISLRRDALTLEDVPALAALLNAVDAHEQLGEPAEEPSIREWLQMPRLDLAEDAVAVRAGEQIVGFGLEIGRASCRERV